MEKRTKKTRNGEKTKTIIKNGTNGTQSEIDKEEKKDKGYDKKREQRRSKEGTAKTNKKQRQAETFCASMQIHDRDGWA